MSNEIDSVGWNLLRLIQENARAPFSQLGKLVGLTAPAVAERVRRMEDSGIIQGYHASVDLKAVGLPVVAFVHLTCNAQQSARFRTAVDAIAQVVECHCVTGNESYILKVAVASVTRLEHLLLDLTHFGEVRTSLVLSTQVARRTIDQRVVGDGDF